MTGARGRRGAGGHAELLLVLRLFMLTVCLTGADCWLMPSSGPVPASFSLFRGMMPTHSAAESSTLLLHGTGVALKQQCMLLAELD